jgi:hypothetical protein
MAAESPPYVQQGASHSAALFRQAMASLLGAAQPGTLALASPNADAGAGASGTTTPGGVVNLNDLVVSQNGTPNMSVNVAGGSVWIPQTQAANGGVYYGLNDASANLAIAASNATNPRIDTVVAVVNDAAYSGSTNNWALSVLTGTATSGATLSNLTGKATQSASSVVIAYVLVPANASTIVTADLLDARPFLTLGSPLRGVPAGKVYVTTGAMQSSGVVTQTPFGGGLLLKGGMTWGSGGLTVPFAGTYFVNAFFNCANTGAISTYFLFASDNTVNGDWMAVDAAVPVSGEAGLSGTAIMACSAGDVIGTQIESTSAGFTYGSAPAVSLNWLEAHLISV